MSHITYASLVPNIMVHTPGCPSPVVERAIKDAVIECNKRTRIFFVYSDLTPVTKHNETGYQMFIDNPTHSENDDLDILSFDNAYYKGKKLTRINHDAAVDRFNTSTISNTSELTHYSVDSGVVERSSGSVSQFSLSLSGLVNDAYGTPGSARHDNRGYGYVRGTSRGILVPNIAGIRVIKIDTREPDSPSSVAIVVDDEFPFTPAFFELKFTGTNPALDNEYHTFAVTRSGAATGGGVWYYVQDIESILIPAGGTFIVPNDVLFRLRNAASEYYEYRPTPVELGSENTLTLWPKFKFGQLPSDVDLENAMRVKMGVTESSLSSSMTQKEYTILSSALFHRTLQQLFTMPGKKWTNLELAAYHAKQFIFHISNIRADSALSDLPHNTALSVQPRSFA